jgi:hypothetical protein
MGLRLKQRKLQPKDLRIIGRKSKNSSRGDALAAAGLDFFMQRVEKVRLDDTAFPAGIAKVGESQVALNRGMLVTPFSRVLFVQRPVFIAGCRPVMHAGVGL